MIVGRVGTTGPVLSAVRRSRGWRIRVWSMPIWGFLCISMGRVTRWSIRNCGCLIVRRVVGGVLRKRCWPGCVSTRQPRGCAPMPNGTSAVEAKALRQQLREQLEAGIRQVEDVLQRYRELYPNFDQLTSSAPQEEAEFPYPLKQTSP